MFFVFLSEKKSGHGDTRDALGPTILKNPYTLKQHTHRELQLVVGQLVGCRGGDLFEVVESYNVDSEVEEWEINSAFNAHTLNARGLAGAASVGTARLNK